MDSGTFAPLQADPKKYRQAYDFNTILNPAAVPLRGAAAKSHDHCAEACKKTR